jgi:hypothetical protein
VLWSLDGGQLGPHFSRVAGVIHALRVGRDSPQPT